MNIFVLDNCPSKAALAHCDKHIVKMIVEYAQLLSCAHRVLDGERRNVEHPLGKKRVAYVLPGESVNLITKLAASKLNTEKTRYNVGLHNAVCYNISHMNHPCAKWVRETDANYVWLFELFSACLQEYTHRYGKVHSTAKLRGFLSHVPKNIPIGQQTPHPQTMPEEYKHENVVEAYHRFYVGTKARFARWTNRILPEWF